MCVCSSTRDTNHTPHNASAQSKHLFQVCVLQPSCFSACYRSISLALILNLNGINRIYCWITSPPRINCYYWAPSTFSCGNSFLSGPLHWNCEFTIADCKTELSPVALIRPKGNICSTLTRVHDLISCQISISVYIYLSFLVELSHTNRVKQIAWYCIFLPD